MLSFQLIDALVWCRMSAVSCLVDACQNVWKSLVVDKRALWVELVYHDIASLDASWKDGFEGAVRTLVLAPYLGLIGVPQLVFFSVGNQLLGIEGNVSDWLQLSWSYLACRIILSHSAWSLDQLWLLFLFLLLLLALFTLWVCLFLFLLSDYQFLQSSEGKLLLNGAHILAVDRPKHELVTRKSTCCLLIVPDMMLPEFALKSRPFQQVISDAFVCLAELDDSLLKAREVESA